MKWRPIQEHQFPWEPHELIVACFYEGSETDIHPEVCIFEAYCAKGDYFQFSAGRQVGLMTLLEDGWTPFLWLDTAPTPHVPSEAEMVAAIEHFRGRLGGIDDDAPPASVPRQGRSERTPVTRPDK